MDDIISVIILVLIAACGILVGLKIGYSISEKENQFILDKCGIQIVETKIKNTVTYSYMVVDKKSEQKGESK